MNSFKRITAEGPVSSFRVADPFGSKGSRFRFLSPHDCSLKAQEEQVVSSYLKKPDRMSRPSVARPEQMRRGRNRPSLSKQLAAIESSRETPLRFPEARPGNRFARPVPIGHTSPRLRLETTLPGPLLLRGLEAAANPAA